MPAPRAAPRPFVQPRRSTQTRRDRLGGKRPERLRERPDVVERALRERRAVARRVSAFALRKGRPAVDLSRTRSCRPSRAARRAPPRSSGFVEHDGLPVGVTTTTDLGPERRPTSSSQSTPCPRGRADRRRRRLARAPGSARAGDRRASTAPSPRRVVDGHVRERVRGCEPRRLRHARRPTPCPRSPRASARAARRAGDREGAPRMPQTVSTLGGRAGLELSRMRRRPLGSGSPRPSPAPLASPA